MNYDQLLAKLKVDLAPQLQQQPSMWGWFWMIVTAIIILIAIFWGLSALGRAYGVWSAHKEGQADLARAQNEQQIQVARAQGRLNAAELDKQAEIIDAQAVAASIEIIGKKLHENEGYLRWKWIEMMDGTGNATIYVPTEGNLPILEAGRLNKPTINPDETRLS